MILICLTMLRDWERAWKWRILEVDQKVNLVKRKILIVICLWGTKALKTTPWRIYKSWQMSWIHTGNLAKRTQTVKAKRKAIKDLDQRNMRVPKIDPWAISLKKIGIACKGTSHGKGLRAQRTTRPLPMDSSSSLVLSALEKVGKMKWRPGSLVIERWKLNKLKS